MLTGHFRKDVDIVILVFFALFFMVQSKSKNFKGTPSHRILPPACAAARSPDGADVGSMCCGPARVRAVPARRSGSVAEEKGGGPGADPVSADSAEGGQGRGDGGTPGRHRLAKTSRSRGILAGPGGKNKLIQFKRV